MPQRKCRRLKEYDYSSSGAYFITVCTQGRKHIFWKDNVGADIIRQHEDLYLSETGKIVKEAIKNIEKIYKGIYVDCYSIMPNHVHLILIIENNADGRIISAPTRSVVIGQMKRFVSKTGGKPIWQKSFYDHIIRNEKDYVEKRRYIEENAVKWEEDKYYNQ